ncbi:MAG: exosortase/archaeosortase family protein, partial [Phycisphaerales bacterium]|nr:exosortase/archaeosortase family protein [Phycisphaerales bacterium]
AFVALGLALAYITPRPTWQRVAMAVFVVPVALMCNILRVIITGCLQMYGHEDLAKGTPHTLLGLIMFAFGFVLYMGLLWVLDHLVVEEQDAAAES